MKNPFESDATFTAYATIEAGYFMLKMYADSVPASDDPLKEHEAKALIPIVEDILAAKKVLEAPTEKEEKMLAMLKACLTPKPPTDEETPQAGKV